MSGLPETDGEVMFYTIKRTIIGRNGTTDMPQTSYHMILISMLNG